MQNYMFLNEWLQDALWICEPTTSDKLVTTDLIKWVFQVLQRQKFALTADKVKIDCSKMWASQRSVGTTRMSLNCVLRLSSLTPSIKPKFQS